MSGGWIIAAFMAVAIAVIAGGLYVWHILGPVQLSWHGWLAIAAGVVGSFALGGVLMALSFYSARSGHDKAAADEQERLNKDR